MVPAHHQHSQLAKTDDPNVCVYVFEFDITLFQTAVQWRDCPLTVLPLSFPLYGFFPLNWLYYVRLGCTMFDWVALCFTIGCIFDDFFLLLVQIFE